MSYEKSINLLKAKGVEFEAGLTDVEMGKIESTYKIEFPKSLKIFLMTVLLVFCVFFFLCFFGFVLLDLCFLGVWLFLNFLIF